MKRAIKRKLKHYLMAHARKNLTLTAILYVGIVSILIFPIPFEENMMAWFGGYFACPLICILLTRTLVKAYLSVNRQFKALEDEGMLEKVIADFGNADKEIGGNLYVGQLGLYGKGSNYAALYRDMDHLYSLISDRRGRNPRDLRWEDRQGVDRFLCELDPIGQSNTEIEALYRAVVKKNPAIRTGKE